MSRDFFTTASLLRLGRWLVGLALFVPAAFAWGPHPKITQAALDTLGTNHPLHRVLGGELARLTNYCWLADYRRLPFRDPEQDFYADDYLLFPGTPTHLDHICPEVKQTYRPYFLRAMQALRTESPANAARWVGSLLHFVEDTGSPPHAAEIRGGPHAAMENWVEARRIGIAGYAPRLLGTNDTDALEGFVRRMDELIAFSKPRGLRLRFQVEIGNRTATEPVVLECALETSRVTADVLHTLGQLAALPAQETAALRGWIKSAEPVGLDRYPAKVILAGTRFSTLTDAAGRYEFHGLPAGTNALTAFRPGSGRAQATVLLKTAVTNMANLTLPAAGNLVRNGDFQFRWVSTNAPDCWTRTPLGWEGEIIPLKKDQHYRLTVKFKPGADADALVRWTYKLPHEIPKPGTLPKIEAKPLTPKESELTFTGTDAMALLQVTLRTRQPAEAVCESITLVTVAE